MTLKPPTRTFPKLVMKEWPVNVTKGSGCIFCDIGLTPMLGVHYVPEEMEALHCALSDFTRVVEETGVLQKEAPLTKRESKHD